jgi:hypothetical protein
MESLFCESKHGLILSNSAKNDSTGFRFAPNQHKVLTHAWKVLVCVKQKLQLCCYWYGFFTGKSCSMNQGKELPWTKELFASDCCTSGYCD